MKDDDPKVQFADILGVRFPRISSDRAVAWLVERTSAGRATAVAFPDMSTMNIAAREPGVKRLLQTRFTTFNDGAGLAWAARRRHQPLPDNLNGTDLCPRLLARLPAGTRVFLLGAEPKVVARAAEVIEQRFPHVTLVGLHDGYFGPDDEPSIVDDMAARTPQVVFVAMGNPRQLQFIDRHRDDPRFRHTTWLAVGGLLDYVSGTNPRAPRWMREHALEWAWIVLTQPHKLRRYVQGIPEYIGRCLLAELHTPPLGA